MIFRRGKKSEVELEVEETTPEPEPTPDAEEEAEADDTAQAEWTELDERDWRTDGPYDISEIDADTIDDLPRIDLGSLILAGFDGMELRLQMAEETQQIVSAMMIYGDSALEVGAFAAPRSGGLWAELRDDLIEGATSSGGSAALAEGPFGVELRRVLQVTTPDGEEGYQPSRMWVAEGPRWLLRGIVYGQAAVVDGVESPVAELLEAFRRIVVRRGDEAKAPGDLLPLSLPQGVGPQPSTDDNGDTAQPAVG